MAAKGHEPVDRVPIDFGAMRSTGIMAIAYNGWKECQCFDGIVAAETGGCTAGILPAVWGASCPRSHSSRERDAPGTAAETAALLRF